MPAGMFSENTNSTLIRWADYKFIWYRISKTYKFYQITLPSLDALKSISDMYGWRISSYFKDLKASLFCPYPWI